MTNFTYKVTSLRSINEQLEQELNSKKEQGWELVKIIGDLSMVTIVWKVPGQA